MVTRCGCYTRVATWHLVAMQAAPTSADDRDGAADSDRESACESACESEYDSARALHHGGATRLSEALGERVREWALVAFVDRMHAIWADEIAHRLEEMRPRWFDGVSDDCNACRPGELVAAQLSRSLRPHGIHVTATHPSAQPHSPWELTGPRFYASLVEAARGPTGCCTAGHAPRPPSALAALLWSTREEASRPWVSELGWTHVPPASHPQQVHGMRTAHAGRANRGGASCGATAHSRPHTHTHTERDLGALDSLSCCPRQPTSSTAATGATAARGAVPVTLTSCGRPTALAAPRRWCPAPSPTARVRRSTSIG